MCDVHLIETARAERDLAGVPCCYCRDPIPVSGIWIEGVLDDGSPGVLGFAYHADCVFLMEFDQEEIENGEGCFSYGSPTKLTPAS